MSVIVQQDMTMCSLLYFCKLLYMFRVVTPPIIRSTYNSNYNIWHGQTSENAVCEVISKLLCNVIRVPYIVANHLKILIPVGLQ
jgi:hypothetical protein